jgi:hypothetical protein
MARPLVALLIAAAALFAGCGGADIAYTEVESPPAELPLPDGEIAVAEDAATTDDDDDDDGNVKTSRATPTVEAVVPSTDTTTTPVDPTTTTPVDPVVPETEEPVVEVPDDSGGAAPPTEEPVTEDPVEPTDDTGGAVAGGASDQFCADNPGAC